MYRALYVTGAYNDEDKKGHVYPGLYVIKLKKNLKKKRGGHVYPGLYAFVGFVVWEHTRKPKKP